MSGESPKKIGRGYKSNLDAGQFQPMFASWDLHRAVRSGVRRGAEYCRRLAGETRDGSPGWDPVQKDGFRETFCADVPVDMADVMFATQRPLAVAALNENATAAGWKSKPSWFLVSEHDNAISPDAERFMAQRMGATTDTIDGSHTAFIAKPVAVATFIRQALR